MSASHLSLMRIGRIACARLDDALSDRQPARGGYSCDIGGQPGAFDALLRIEMLHSLENQLVAEMWDRRTLATLGGAMMLFAPILLCGAIALAGASADSATLTSAVLAYVFLALSVMVLVGGLVVWLRHR